jgi:hypothetical protein
MSPPGSWLLSAMRPPVRAPACNKGAAPMRDYLAAIEILRKNAADAALIRDLAIDAAKRNMFARLHDHFILLADEIQRIIEKNPIT